MIFDDACESTEPFVFNQVDIKLRVVQIKV